jgi:hypothetical protein
MTFLDHLVEEMEYSLKRIKEYMAQGNFEYATSTLLSFVDEVNASGNDHELLMGEY